MGSISVVLSLALPGADISKALPIAVIFVVVFALLVCLKLRHEYRDRP